MSAFYKKMQKTSSRLLKKFSQGEITYQIETKGGGPDWNPSPGGLITYTLDAVAKGVDQKYVRDGYISASDIQITAAILPTGYKYKREVDGVIVEQSFSSISITDWFAYFFAPYTKPTGITIEGTLSIDGREHQIIEVQRIPAAGTVVAWRMFVKS